MLAIWFQLACIGMWMGLRLDRGPRGLAGVAVAGLALGFMALAPKNGAAWVGVIFFALFSRFWQPQLSRPSGSRVLARAAFAALLALGIATRDSEFWAGLPKLAYGSALALGSLAIAFPFFRPKRGR